MTSSQSGDESAPIVVREATRLTEEVVEAVRRLVPQLNPTADPATREQLESLVSGPSTRLLLAVVRSGGREAIVGMLTLAWYPIPTGIRAWIEDVVVDAPTRGRGVGESLVHAALELARELGAHSVDLTSRPQREAANRLYQRMGFQRRETNAYRYLFPR